MIGFQKLVARVGIVSVLAVQFGACSKSGGSGATSRVWGAAKSVPTVDDAGSAYLPRVALPPSGFPIVAWHQSLGGGLTGIFASRYAGDIGTFGAPVQISISDAGSATGAQVVADESGNAVAAWTQSSGGPTVGSEIWASRFNGQSGSWSAASRVASLAGGPSDAPAVSGDLSGNASVVWRYTASGKTEVWANAYLASEGSWVGASRISGDAGGWSLWPLGVNVDSTGNAVAAWSETDGGQVGVASNRWTRASKTWATPAQAVFVASGMGSVAFGGQFTTGNNVLAWAQTVSGVTSLMSSRLASGGSWETAATIQQDIGPASCLAVGLDPAGIAAAVWDRSDRSGVWANRFAPGSASAYVVESSDAGNPPCPAVLVDQQGNAIAYWIKNEPPAPFITTVSRFDTSPAAWSAPTTMQANDGGFSNFPHAAVNRDGKAIIVWQELVSGSYKVFASFLP
jgi:hypothetical protein